MRRRLLILQLTRSRTANNLSPWALTSVCCKEPPARRLKAPVSSTQIVGIFREMLTEDIRLLMTKNHAGTKQCVAGLHIYDWWARRRALVIEPANPVHLGLLYGSQDDPRLLSTFQALIAGGNVRNKLCVGPHELSRTVRRDQISELQSQVGSAAPTQRGITVSHVTAQHSDRPAFSL